MPRPPRNRVGATRTRPTAAAAPVARNSSSPPLPVLPKQGENDAQNDIVQNDLPSDIYDVSDAEKERRKLRASAKKAAPVETSTTTTRRTRQSVNHTLELNSDQIRALDSSRKHRDNAMARLNDMTSTSKAGSDVEYSRRESVLGDTTTRHDASGLDVDLTLGSLDDSLGVDDSTEIEMGDDSRMTRATNTSTFNIAGFKRKPRQSSVQGRGDAPIRPSSRGQATPSISTTISFGRFKRRQREPSILGTARKNRRQRSVSRGSQASRNREVLGLDRGDESGPEGESTPIDAGNRRSTTRGRSRGVESEGEMNGPPVAAGSRKRKSLESHQDGREKRLAVDGEDMDVEVENRDEEPDLDFDLDAELEPRAESPVQEQAEDVHQSIEIDEQPPISSSLSSPPREFSTPPQLFDENDPDLAPPMSSSPSEAGSPIAWPSLNTLAQRKYNTRAVPTKTPELDDDDMGSNISSPPSLTHSPNYRANSKPAVAKKKAPPPPKSSADLASLLPRRKASSKNTNRNGTNSADPFDLDDGEGSEEEAPPPTRRAAKKPLAKSCSAMNKGKQKETAPADHKGKKKRVTRTYSSKAHEQDKENGDDNAGGREEESIVVGSDGNEPEEEEEEEELPEAETTAMLTERLGEELQKAVKKFKEVDQWELSFEEVSGSSSPMRDAR